MTPFIVGIGGTTSRDSSTESAINVALTAARTHGARTRLFGSEILSTLPHYAPGAVDRSSTARELVDAVRAADGLIFASPGYHGSVSGLVKNGIDYIEETASDARTYLDGLPVGLIVTAYGWQAIGSTLATLRSIVHGLRGWPTPLGAGVKAASGLFADGACTDSTVSGQLELVGQQVVGFAQLRRRKPAVMLTGRSDNN
ncbi:NADPH-dependent FMN reductase [Sphingomonas sp. TREG-RG-20F-R18-01]|uniref:NADPH-dependent FMN reductase n=1 Tax=Sphingomonas sp. TREG-RG-20F-R18-01 TaxID=2914982 RepID=UPI001F56F91A|nr:NADPH-dependent FMN reductase [Sphingomonas sp. TREG-RG-20F-R18-01]